MLIALVLANYVGGFRTASAAATRRARSMELLQTLAVDLIRSDDLRPAAAPHALAISPTASVCAAPRCA